jgi:hypothetical protein
MILTILQLVSLIPTTLKQRSERALENLPIRGESNRDPAPGMPRSCDRNRGNAPEANCSALRGLLSSIENALGVREGFAGASCRAVGGDGKRDRDPGSRRSSPPVRSARGVVPAVQCCSVAAPTLRFQASQDNAANKSCPQTAVRAPGVWRAVRFRIERVGRAGKRSPETPKNGPATVLAKHRIRLVHSLDQPGPRTPAAARELRAAVGIVLMQTLRSFPGSRG